MTEDEFEFIPLLSGKSFDSFSPQDYHNYIKSLYWKSEQKKIEAKPFTFRLNKKGTLILRVNRNPKWMSQSEIEGIMQKLNLPWDLITEKFTKAKIELRR